VLLPTLVRLVLFLLLVEPGLPESRDAGAEVVVAAGRPSPLVWPVLLAERVDLVAEAEVGVVLV
jgi:hypothetical protein